MQKVMTFYPTIFNNSCQFDSSNNISSSEQLLSQQSTASHTTFTHEPCNETIISMGSQETIIDHHNMIENSLESLSQFNTPIQKNKGYNYLSDSLLNTEKIVHETPEGSKSNKAFDESNMDEEKPFNTKSFN